MCIGNGSHLHNRNQSWGLFTYYVSQNRGFLEPTSPLRQQWSAFGLPPLVSICPTPLLYYIFLRRQRILCCSSMFILITLECVFSALVETFIWLVGWVGGLCDLERTHRREFLPENMNGGAPLFQLSLLRVLIQREAGQNRSYHAGTEVNPLECQKKEGHCG